MKIRYRLAAIASAVALAGAGALAVHGAASAGAAVYPFCVNSDGTCIGTDGTGNPVGLSYGTPANFGQENAEGAFVEYYHNSTDGCLTDSGANVYIQTCTAGDGRQLWEWQENPTLGYGPVINRYATSHYGVNECMTKNSGSGDAIIVEACDGAADQQWWYVN